MQMLSFVWGISVGAIMIVALFPCLGWINWLNIPLGIAGLIISLIAISSEDKVSSTYATVGIVGSSVAVFFGMIRLILGAGVF